MVTLNWLQPEVGTMITATTTDPEGVGGTDPDIAGTVLVEYTWYRSKVADPDDVSPNATEDDLAVQWEKIETRVGRDVHCGRRSEWRAWHCRWLQLWWRWNRECA